MRNTHIFGTAPLRQDASIGGGHTAGVVKRLLAASVLATAGLAGTASTAHAALINVGVNANVSPNVCDVNVLAVDNINVVNTGEQEQTSETECTTENEQTIEQDNEG